MTPTEQGRYCDKCAAVVVDFSLMSTHEILEYVKKQKSKVCGRVNTAHLAVKNTLPKKLQYFLYIFALVFLLLNPTNSIAQHTAPQYPIQLNTTKHLSDSTLPIDTNTTLTKTADNKIPSVPPIDANPQFNSQYILGRIQYKEETYDELKNHPFKGRFPFQIF